MQVIHIFNSGGLNGPELLVLPALHKASWLTEIWSLHETRISGTNRLEEYCSQNNLPFRRICVDARFDRAAIAKMRSRISVIGRPAIFHSHDAKASVYTWAALWPLQLKDCRSIVTHHGALARPDRRSRIYEQIMTQGSRIFASRVLCVCSGDYDLLSKRGVPKKKLRIHHNGIDRPVISWNERRASVPHGRKRLAIVGRLSPEKNHQRLLSVLKELADQNRIQWSLDILGEGPLRVVLEEQCRNLGISENVIFRGYCIEAWREYDQYDCLLNFSHGEGFPVTLLEAGLRRTPVFASAVGGIPELCGAEGAELFGLNESDINIGERLARFCSDEERLKSRAENLFHRVSERFSQTHWLTSLESIYRESLGGKA
jgi:glycosyltransferase involved in cell wall biosynthesis